MNSKHSMRIATAVVIAFSFLVTGCSASSAPAAPSPDPGIIATAAVQTYQAQQSLTQAAAHTDTPAPTTANVNSGDAPLATETNGPIVPSQTAQIYIAPEEKASLVSQKPVDGSEVRLGNKFDVVWTVKNDGKTTWSKTFTVRYYAGAALGEGYIFKFGKDVPPGGQIDVSADMIAPNYPGTFNSIWVLTNDKGENFYQVFVTVKVVDRKPSTSTPTPNLTPAATSAG